jgi:RIO-like serine/threonine protein kinase
MTNHDLDVLRALARLSRMRKAVDCEALALRSGGSLEEARASLARLSRAALVERTEGGARLTMMGLAIAVASARSAPAARRQPARQPAGRRRAA